MNLAAGKRLGPYEVVSLIGAGGMGEVYRARDSRLGRDVAIKVLPEAFARDPERLARFQREAQLLATLNHPNIAIIHGLEEQEQVRFLVLELVEGETLAERLARGPIAVEEALPLFRQIAEALEAAHEKGIVHRDLKPANVKITPDGKVKVLDFGLAKDMVAAAAAGSDLSLSPTLTTPMATRVGVIMGTAAYMSPEQARGKAVDKRTDIWAFGCVCYEALTGRAVFGGDTVTDIVAAIVRAEPDWNALDRAAPPRVRALVRRCLHKDAMLRLRDIGDARIELGEAFMEPEPPAPIAVAAAPPVASVPAKYWLLFSLLLVVAAIAAGMASWFLKPENPQALRRAVLPISPAEVSGFGVGSTVAISPDGKTVVFVAGRRESGRQLVLRPLDRMEVTPIPGTENAYAPFFSPDGQWIGFFTPGALKKVPVAGGAVLTICDAPNGRGATWGADNTIIFAPNTDTGLMRVPAAGGTPTALTKVAGNDRGHRWPQILPSGKAIIFITGPSGANPRAVAYRLDTGEQRDLIAGARYARYSPTGHLVYTTAAVAMAVTFDARRLEVSGTPFPLPEEISGRAASVPHMDFSAEGSLAYVDVMTDTDRILVSVSREGAATALTEAPRLYSGPRLSPDGQRVLLEITENPHSIWVYDTTRRVLTRTTFDAGHHSAVLTPDGKRITFVAEGNAKKTISWRAADGSGAEQVLSERPDRQTRLGGWSPDGKMLVFSEDRPETKVDIWVMPADKPSEARPFLQSPASERNPVFSPDGRWLAYRSDESGRNEVYVVAFPGPGGKWQISTSGGLEPAWSRNGRELFYREGNKMMAVPVTLHPAFSAGTPRMLFEGEYTMGAFDRAYDTDGQRFIMIRNAEARPRTSQIHLVLNWFNQLKRGGL